MRYLFSYCFGKLYKNIVGTKILLLPQPQLDLNLYEYLFISNIPTINQNK